MSKWNSQTTEKLCWFGLTSKITVYQIIMSCVTSFNDRKCWTFPRTTGGHFINFEKKYGKFFIVVFTHYRICNYNNWPIISGALKPRSPRHCGINKIIFIAVLCILSANCPQPYLHLRDWFRDWISRTGESGAWTPRGPFADRFAKAEWILRTGLIINERD